MRFNGYLEPGSLCKKCHNIEGDIICDFCYCPLYYTDCGGDYEMMASGIKDCSNCIRPHVDPFFNKVV